MPLPDTASRAATRVLAIYNLAGQVRVRPGLLHPLTGSFNLGRFARHVEAAGRLLPQVAALERIDPALFHIPAERPGARVRRVAACLATTPRHDGLLLLDVEFDAEPTTDDVADYLYATWRERARIRVGDVALLDWLSARLGGIVTEPSGPLAFGQNVHQCVFAGGRLARRLLRNNKAATPASPDVVGIVFRGTVAAKRGTDLDIRRPAALNNRGQTMVAHGRGVSLIAGWAEPVENAFGVAAAGLVNAAGVVRRIRLQSLEALEFNESAADTSASQVRGLITSLSERLNELQLDLSFGVEAYADATLMPELLVENYHSSLRSVAALPESLANTSRIVGRVAAVIESRHTMLGAAAQEYTERRDKIFATVVAIGSLLALPPALLLAYFGVNSSNVDPHRSIFDMGHYGLAYLAAWTPFIALVALAAIMRRRVPRNRLPPD